MAITGKPLAVMDFADKGVPDTADTHLLREAGVTVEGRRCWTEDEVIELAKDADVLLDGLGPITRKVLTSLPRTKVVARYGVGVDNVDLAAATEEGITVVHVPDYCIEEVSNHVIVFLLMWAKQIVPLDRSIRSGDWAAGKRSPMRDVQSIHQQTLGLLGAGRIGMATARKAKALSMEVLVYDPYIDSGLLKEEGLTPATMPEVLAQGDYVSLHVPLTPETHHMISKDQLRLMKASAFLMNVSRGPIVDEPALVEALQKGTIAGAGIDVFEHEPLPVDSPLYAMDNVILTPHAAHFSPLAQVRARRQIGEEVIRALSGDWPINVANPAVKGKSRLEATS